jgi:outer membrane translocation and assembly module TamA
LFSQFELSRESQIDFEEFLITLKPHMKWTRDIGGYHHTYLLGPSYEAGTYHSKENIDTKSFSTGLLSGGIQIMSHSYEHYDIHPDAGDLFAINFDFRDPGLGFKERLLKLDSTYVKLARLSNWGRGTLVGGVRFNAGTTWVSDDVSLNGLPPTVKFYGGGSDDLRGFHLKTLPQNDGLGALSKIGTKLELRRTYMVKESIEGFTFLDFSYFGTQSWELDPQLFYSPGLGLRWLSPIGLVQGFVARAYRTDPYQDHGNLLYLGIGGVF